MLQQKSRNVKKIIRISKDIDIRTHVFFLLQLSKLIKTTQLILFDLVTRMMVYGFIMYFKIAYSVSLFKIISKTRF